MEKLRKEMIIRNSIMRIEEQNRFTGMALSDLLSLMRNSKTADLNIKFTAFVKSLEEFKNEVQKEDKKKKDNAG